MLGNNKKVHFFLLILLAIFFRCISLARWNCQRKNKRRHVKLSSHVSFIMDWKTYSDSDLSSVCHDLLAGNLYAFFYLLRTCMCVYHLPMLVHIYLISILACIYRAFRSSASTQFVSWFYPRISAYSSTDIVSVMIR